MSDERGRIFATHIGRFSKIVDAPLRYVYTWCTDFRPDDRKFEKSKPRHRVVIVAPRRLVRIKVAGRGVENPRMAVELVRLSPPNAWHKDTIGETDLDAIDYRLTSLGPKKTRVSLVIVERWLVPTFPKKSDWLRRSSEYWDELVRAIEERYRNGQPAKG